MGGLRWVTHLVAAAVTAGPGVGVRLEPTGSAQAVRVRVLVETGQRGPGGTVFSELSDPSINNLGDVAFGAVSSPPSVREALYIISKGRLTRVVASGDPAPSGGRFTSFSDVQLSDRGTLVFLGRTTDRVGRLGLYLARQGRITPVAVTGQPAPSGGTFTDFANPTINSRDVVAFVGRTQGREGIFRSSEGAVAPAVLAGTPSPSGGEFQFFLDSSPAQNNRGEIAFVASTTTQAQGVYVLVGGRSATVATTDDVAPTGSLFTEFGFVTMTDAGTVGFVGRTARGTPREALYVTGRTELLPLARQGQQVGGEVLTTFVNTAMDSQEDVVFEPGTPDPIPRAVYVASRAGVRPLLVAGAPAPGGRHFRAFSTPSLNDRGQVALVAETDDGRHGIYVVTFR